MTSGTGSPRATPAAAVAALVGLVVGLLLFCGAGAGAAAAPAGQPREVAVAAAPGEAAVAAVSGPAGPGCGQDHGGDQGAATPAVPPRSHALGELLPAPAGERTPCGGWGADQDEAATVPGPEPPELVPPTHVELSVLRV
ncbi:hypothetical protein [Streptomyces roseicoloratus]|uniref:hypothetical protein n=1 Tax=Streptomyces roseicoloratus TaxID=2508722 RepID=UPI001009893A|nr:hypothetical protein [Streptomyces roseicoloratus]